MERLSPDEYTLFRLRDGSLLKTHGPAVCGNVEGGAREYCSLHNPSDHPMREWPIVIRDDMFYLVERTCPHGVGHPDPDSLAYFRTHDLDLGVHGCDGCCTRKES